MNNNLFNHTIFDLINIFKGLPTEKIFYKSKINQKILLHEISNLIIGNENNDIIFFDIYRESFKDDKNYVSMVFNYEVNTKLLKSIRSPNHRNTNNNSKVFIQLHNFILHELVFNNIQFGNTNKNNLTLSDITELGLLNKTIDEHIKIRNISQQE